jgi:hypothetical protein
LTMGRLCTFDGTHGSTLQNGLKTHSKRQIQIQIQTLIPSIQIPPSGLCHYDPMY